MNWRSLFAAFYAQDVIRVTPNLTLTLGFRGESSTGWNEAHGRAANYTFTDGVISDQPRIANDAFTVNNAKFLPEPRIGVAWGAVPGKTVVRAGFGMYNELQDALGYRMDQNAPFNPVYSIANLPVSQLPINPLGPVPSKALLIPGGVQPNLKMPTLLSYSLGIEQEITPNTSLTLRYVGSHGYHEFIGVDANEPVPVICPASPCPAVYPANFPAPLAGTPVPAGSFYIPAGTPKANPTLANTWTWFSVGDSYYNALQVDFNHRFSHGLSLRGVYTWSKALDDGDSLNQTTAGNAPGLVSNPYDIRADWGLATYDVRNLASISAVYDLPIGHGQKFVNGWNGFANGLVSGWSVNSIVRVAGRIPIHSAAQLQPVEQRRHAQSGAAVREPELHRPDRSPAIRTSGSIPAAFLAPPPNSGFYGNLGRNTLIGPGLATWDFSTVKDTRLQRAPDAAVPRRDLQPAEPRELQHPKPDHLHAVGRFGNRRSNHQHLDDGAAGAVRVEVVMVEKLIVTPCD